MNSRDAKFLGIVVVTLLATAVLLVTGAVVQHGAKKRPDPPELISVE